MYSWHFDAIEAETSVFEQLTEGKITIDQAITNLELLPEILKKIADSKGDSEKSEIKLMLEKMAMRLHELKHRHTEIAVSKR